MPLHDGRTFHRIIKHAIGSVEKPMSDKQLEQKFTGLAEGVLPDAQIKRVMQMCWSLTDLKSPGDVARARAQA